MRTKDEKISTGTLGIVIASFLMGVGILTVPRTVTTATGGFGGWLSLLATGLLFIVIGGFAAGYLLKMFPGENLILFGSRILTKPLNAVVCFLFLLYFTAAASLHCRILSDVMKLYVLDTTPPTVIIGSLLLVSTYVVSHGINTIVRLNILFFPLVFGILALILFLNVRGDFTLEEVRPFFVPDIAVYTKGITSSLYVFVGIGLLYFLAPFIKRPEKIPLSVAIGIGVVTFSNIITLFIAVGIFNFAAVQNIVYPTIELAKDIAIPGAFIERIEAFYMTVWVLAIFSAVSSTHYVVSLGMSQLFNGKQKLWAIWPLPLFFLIAMAPENIDEYFRWKTVLSYVGTTFLIGVPVLYILIAKIRKVI
ncbi:endospore germination permease [Alteribacillus sp. HJP-4]|uniref:GerAB/ArcD/ProY family transporter n=1 Tax=Alteribacillus sp. HJP-4 TaxID=2775394 RepID=UPI0035CCDE72